MWGSVYFFFQRGHYDCYICNFYSGFLQKYSVAAWGCQFREQRGLSLGGKGWDSGISALPAWEKRLEHEGKLTRWQLMRLQPIKKGWGAESHTKCAVCSLCQEGLEGDTIFSVLLSSTPGRRIWFQPEPKCSVIPFPPFSSLLWHCRFHSNPDLCLGNGCALALPSLRVEVGICLQTCMLCGEKGAKRWDGNIFGNDLRSLPDVWWHSLAWLHWAVVKQNRNMCVR